MKDVLIVFLTLIVLGLSCKKDNPPTMESSSLVKTKWALSYIQDTKTKEVINYPSDTKNKITISFSDSLNILKFTGVCNNGGCQYSYSMIDGSLKITELILTCIYCNYAEWENYVRNSLYDASKYKTYGNTLEIDSKGRYNLFFVKTQY